MFDNFIVCIYKMFTNHKFDINVKTWFDIKWSAMFEMP